MKRIVTLVVAMFSITSAHAGTYNYICKNRGKPYPLKIDDNRNTLEWKGDIYKIKENRNCGKFGWHAEKDSTSFDFCTATQGYADFEQNGVLIRCNLQR